MNANVVKAIIGQLGLDPRPFLGGWMEGRTRYVMAADKNVIPGSVFTAGSIAFAASQASVAYHQARGDDA